MLQGRWSYYAVYFPSLLLLAVLMCTIGLLMPFRQRMEMATLWSAFMGRIWLHWGGGIRVEIEGRENIPTEPCVILSNHQSEWETIYVPRLVRPTAIVLKSSLTKIPVYGWSLSLAHPIGIDRSSPISAIRDILRKGSQRLAEQNNVLIFAEGTRVPPGKIKKYKRTGAELAIKAGVPILPVVHNAGDCWSPRRWFRRGTITMRIGKPISSKHKDSTALTNEAEIWATENYPGQLQPDS